MNLRNRFDIAMKKIVTTFCAVLWVMAISSNGCHAETKPFTGVENNPKEIVILLHGLGRTSTSMFFLERALTAEGFEVKNLGYPSRALSIEQITAEYLEPVVAKALEGSSTVHFVTHSMGGIILRHYLAKHSPDYIGHIVMLAPPNRGSEIIDVLGEYKLFGRTMGPAALQLSTSADSMPNAIGAIDYPVGVIAGNISCNPLSSGLINGENDGKVSVESTRLAGMNDHLIVNTSHTFIMNNGVVVKQTINFLRLGRFNREDDK